jgi:MoaA/NifB/PqqE/SkfB family radical SAM enzyme
VTLVNALPLALRFYARVRSGKPIGASINVSGRCPVDCVCYWRIGLAAEFDIPLEDIGAINRAGQSLEMSDDKLVAFLERLRDEGYLLVQLVGGEPYVRRALLPRLGGILPWTWIATSGTTPFIRMKRTTHFVSLDGADAKIHDQVRRSPGLFGRIIKNLHTARKEGDFPVHIHMVLNHLNYHQIEQTIEQICLEDNLADSVAFSMHTPMSGKGDQHLYLTDMDRQRAQDMLFRTQEKYPEQVSMSKAMIQRFDVGYMRAQRPETCLTSRYVSSYREDGKRIPQCIFGPDADCSECGCAVTTMLHALLWPPDLQTARIAARLMPLRDQC